MRSSGDDPLVQQLPPRPSLALFGASDILCSRPIALLFPAVPLPCSALCAAPVVFPYRSENEGKSPAFLAEPTEEKRIHPCYYGGTGGVSSRDADGDRYNVQPHLRRARQHPVRNQAFLAPASGRASDRCHRELPVMAWPPISDRPVGCRWIATHAHSPLWGETTLRFERCIQNGLNFLHRDSASAHISPTRQVAWRRFIKNIPIDSAARGCPITGQVGV
jgi:hypothetical protein